MIHKSINALTAAALSAAMLLSSVPAAEGETKADAADAEGVVYSTDFEDGDVSKLSKRGDEDTSVIEAVEDTDAPSGSKVMSITERSNGWNGPSLAAAGFLEPNVKYVVTAKVKAKWYNTVRISLQHTPGGSDEPQYSNLVSGKSDGKYIELTTAFSFPDTDKDVSIYIECDDKADLYIDDFSISLAPNKLDKSLPGLKDVYADMFKFGTATTTQEIAPESTKELVKHHFNSLTAGNELKPDSVLDKKACLALAADGDDTDPQVTLANAKPILDFARDNNIPVRGHVLVWHQQTPLWFFKENYDEDGEWVSKEKMLKRMENYIKNVFTAVKAEYPDVDFYAWDVVNECFTDGGSPRSAGFPAQENNYEASPWVKIFGDNSFIKPAFVYAKKYAPEGTKLYYNDFNEYMQKSDAIVKLAEDINSDGHYIDGIGMQSHLNVTNNGTNDPFPSVSMYKSALEKYSKTGLDIQITELDATVDDARYELQAQYYSDIFDAIVEYKDYVSAVVVWGTTDDQSWRASKDPLLFNKDYEAKDAYFKITDGIEIPEIVTTTTKATTTASSTTATTTTTVSDTDTTTAPSANLIGDANLDKKVSVADAVAILQSIANKDKYALKPEGAANADCFDPGDGVTANDALAIQKLDAGSISKLPEYSK